MLYKMDASGKVYLRLYNTQPDKAFIKSSVQDYKGKDLEVASLFKEAIKIKRVEYITGTSQRTGNYKAELSLESAYHIVRYYAYGLVHPSLNKLWKGLLDAYKDEIIEDLSKLGITVPTEGIA